MELLEPSLPAWRHNVAVPLAPEEAGHSAVAWLLSRDLLPDAWAKGEVDPATWREMLSRFLGWYGLSTEGTPLGSADGSDPVADLALALDLAGAAVRPLAVIAHEDGEARFAGVIWNWSTYPRLLVSRLPGGLAVAAGPGSVLEQLSNCALTVSDYALAPVSTAWQLFVGTGDSDMYVLASDPERPAWPEPVARDDVRSFLEFTAGPVRGTLGFSAAFAGQELGLGAILSLLTKIRTNVQPLKVGWYLAVPDR